MLRNIPSAAARIVSDDLFHAVHAVEQGVNRPPEAISRPDAEPGEAVFSDELQPRPDAARVLEPDDVPLPRRVGVVEPRGLSRRVVFDLRPARNRQLQSPGVGEHPCRRPLLPGQRPVVGVVGKAHQDLPRGHDGHGIVQHPPYPIDRRNRLRRAVGIAPLISLDVSRTQSKKKSLNIPENHIIMMAKCLFLPQKLKKCVLQHTTQYKSE